MYPKLPKSYKNAYPFRISAPSFIYPDDYIPNVRMLGPYLDEIELLCFESHESSLPSQKTIRELETLAKEFKITYNIHLPTDINPGSPERKEMNRFIETLLHVMDLTLPLAPTTYTLHLPCNQASIAGGCDITWRDRISESIRGLLDAGVKGPTLSVETLNYPLEWIEPILRDFDLRVCLDMGHLIANHVNIETTYHRFAGQTTMVHLHGVHHDKDHLSLEALDQNWLDKIFSILQRFTGTVSIEVFSYDHLLASLAVLENNMR